jgi:hypothetical protein
MEIASINKINSERNLVLLTKVKERFTSKQQQLFITNFYSYLNCHKTDDFVISLGEIWEWLGFTRKDAAKRALIQAEDNEGNKLFQNEVDYKTIFHPNVEKKVGRLLNSTENIETRGRKTKDIVMNITTFKRFCQIHNQEVQQYYIQIEEMLNELVEEELHEKIRLLENNRMELEAEKQTCQELTNKLLSFTHRTYEEKPRLEHTYIMKENSQLDTNVHKVGEAGDVRKRETNLGTGNSKGIKAVFAKKVTNQHLVEYVIKNVLGIKYKYVKEFFSNDMEFTKSLIHIVGEVISTIECSWENISHEALVAKVIENISKPIVNDLILIEKREEEIKEKKNLKHKAVKEVQEVQEVKEKFIENYHIVNFTVQERTNDILECKTVGTEPRTFVVSKACCIPPISSTPNTISEAYEDWIKPSKYGNSPKDFVQSGITPNWKSLGKQSEAMRGRYRKSMDCFKYIDCYIDEGGDKNKILTFMQDLAEQYNIKTTNFIKVYFYNAFHPSKVDTTGLTRQMLIDSLVKNGFPSPHPI